MSNHNIEKYITNFLKKYYILLTISLVGLFLIILPFVISNNLEGFDTFGQYANAYYLKNFFWPYMSGWNSFFLSGFPQGVFYPSLFHWLTATLSFIFPLDISYKIILSFSIISFPIIVFIMALKLFKSYTRASATLIIIGVIYYFDVGLNDNLFSDIYFGMSSHLFSLTLFFLYIYSLYILIKNNKKWYLSSILLAILILTHVITFSVAVLFSFILLILSWKNITLKINLLKHYIFSFFLSLFWVIPFIMNIQYVSGGNMSQKEASLITICIPFILILSIISFKIKNEYSIIFKSICIFNISIFIAYILSRLFQINNFPIHFSRLLIYPFLLSPILLIYYLNDKKINWDKLNLFLLFCFCFYSFNFRVLPIGPFDIEILNNIDKYWQEGRIIVTGDSSKLDDRMHSTRTKLAINHNMPIAGGLFTESSSNGWFMMSLLRSWEGRSNYTFIWGYNDLKDVIDLSWGSKIFGINYEYRIQDIMPTIEEQNLMVQKQNNHNEQINNNLNFKIQRVRVLDDENVISKLMSENSPFYYQTFYKTNSTGLAETLNIKPVNIINNWKENTIKWWSTDWLKTENSYLYEKPILIYKTNVENWNIPINKSNLKLIENNKMNSFTIDASELKEFTPIYVKVEYFPYWKAYDENGQKLDIYKASPNFMLVYGKGKIMFKYAEPSYQNWFYLISGIALIYLIIKSIIEKLKK